LACKIVARFKIFFRQKSKKNSARIHSPDPFLRAESKSETPPNFKNISLGFAKSFPQKIVLVKPSPHFAPPHCPNTWRAEHQKRKVSFPFLEKITPAKTEKQGTFFLFWCCREKRGGDGAIVRAYDSI